MRKAYILSDQNVIIEVAKTNSDRFMLLMELIHTNDISTHQFFNIEFNLEDTRKKIIELLNERSDIALDLPSYVGRFTEEEIFVNFNFQGKSYKLCTTGFDNKIIFLLNIYMYVLENNIESKLKCKLLIVNNGKEFRDWLEKLQ
ncbi:hypothetical protein [Flavobacterium sp. LC2016-01]|uniref:hypothetical protein n=1 Tax=Flavobacterium sp. LC2016-01 TaxID=2675876 RepID=UPI0012BA6612|nr:hypothetical protein [Flavobacterium sp. LC2016-01]MTH15805.1 hypothetical protein [Flavobacterium sp. LC2016-01]